MFVFANYKHDCENDGPNSLFIGALTPSSALRAELGSSRNIYSVIKKEKKSTHFVLK